MHIYNYLTLRQLRQEKTDTGDPENRPRRTEEDITQIMRTYIDI
jgi:hypothetical protein